MAVMSCVYRKGYTLLYSKVYNVRLFFLPSNFLLNFSIFLFLFFFHFWKLELFHRVKVSLTETTDMCSLLSIRKKKPEGNVVVSTNYTSLYLSYVYNRNFFSAKEITEYGFAAPEKGKVNSICNININAHAFKSSIYIDGVGWFLWNDQRIWARSYLEE